MYKQIAEACFRFDGTDDTITVDNVPFTWDGVADRDIAGAQAVAQYISNHNLTEGKPITLLWVSCKGVKEDA
jgi:hypothetical protein